MVFPNDGLLVPQNQMLLADQSEMFSLEDPKG
jgi:hypothetical protein